MRKKAMVIALLIFSTACLQSCKTTKSTSPAVESTKKEQPVKASIPKGERLVLISTEYGDMKVKLYDATPKHRDNFIKLAGESYFDSLLFHRVIKGFMIQGGDPLSKNAPAGKMLGMGDIGYTIPAEFVDTIYHKKGSLCAARTSNPEKASSGCQFYIVQGQTMNDEQLNALEAQIGKKLSEKHRNDLRTLGGTPRLDQDYTVFGEVVDGMDVIDKIAAVQTGTSDRPVKDVRMKIKVLN